ncbi:MAG: cytochrome c biogenesis protein ResB [Desulfopila sp.]|jgi:cytochrome c biogenesis protein|nr:cytochrome c biogenesis protein ResB [Desulfopila sp.]
MKNTSSLWKFFSSVKLALFTLAFLAITSILGTVIPQKEPIEFYVNTYGPQTAAFFQVLDIPDMYSSWWFLGFLGILTANLVICSIDRFPSVWRQMTADYLDLPIERIYKNQLSATIESKKTLPETIQNLQQMLKDRGWKTVSRPRNDKMLLFSQKMPWSRSGVYLVHLSILVIFAGAGYGQLTGFKGSIMLPELQSSTVVYPFRGGQPIDLGFEIRCERFDIEFYPNTMPKEYRSKLTILENDTVVLQKDIVVNDPLKYRGITFYQSSYQGFRDFIFTIADQTGESTLFTGDFQKELTWAEKNIQFGIINLETVRDRVDRIKIWFNDGKGPPAEFWMDAAEEVQIHRPNMTYLFSAKQRYATGLQVAKDPGVWIVYLGCSLMLAGLYIAFFLSHRRIWVIVYHEDTTTIIDMKGTANKNKTAFAAQFEKLSGTLAKHM